MRRIAPLPLSAAAALLLVACGSSGGSAASPANESSASASPSRPVAAPQDVVAAGAVALTVPGGMDWITTAGDSVWTSNESLVRLDARTGNVLSTLPLDDATCLAPDVGFGSLWIGVCSSTSQVLRVDPASGNVTATAALPTGVRLKEESSIAAGAGAVWALTTSATIVKIDPMTAEVISSAPAPVGGSAVRATEDALWVTVHDKNALLRLDPATLATVATIDVGKGPQFLAIGEGAVWTLDQAGGTVTRVSATTNEVVATIRVDALYVDGGDIAVGSGFVWARVTDALVAKIDPRNNSVVDRYGPPGGSGSVAADGSAAWITAHDSDTVYRLPLS